MRVRLLGHTGVQITEVRANTRRCIGGPPLHPSHTAADPFAARACRKEGYKVILLNSNPVRLRCCTEIGVCGRRLYVPESRAGKNTLRPRLQPPGLLRRLRGSFVRSLISRTYLSRRSVVQATIMTDPGMADRTYIGPMTPELVEQILAKVRSNRSGGGAWYDTIKLSAISPVLPLLVGFAQAHKPSHYHCRNALMLSCPPWVVRPA